jgi:hypothetical protein
MQQAGNVVEQITNGPRNSVFKKVFKIGDKNQMDAVVRGLFVSLIFGAIDVHLMPLLRKS